MPPQNRNSATTIRKPSCDLGRHLRRQTVVAPTTRPACRLDDDGMKYLDFLPSTTLRCGFVKISSTLLFQLGQGDLDYLLSRRISQLDTCRFYFGKSSWRQFGNFTSTGHALLRPQASTQTFILDVTIQSSFLGTFGGIGTTGLDVTDPEQFLGRARWDLR